MPSIVIPAGVDTLAGVWAVIPAQAGIQLNNLAALADDIIQCGSADTVG